MVFVMLGIAAIIGGVAVTKIVADAVKPPPKPNKTTATMTTTVLNETFNTTSVMAKSVIVQSQTFMTDVKVNTHGGKMVFSDITQSNENVVDLTAVANQLADSEIKNDVLDKTTTDMETEMDGIFTEDGPPNDVTINATKNITNRVVNNLITDCFSDVNQSQTFMEKSKLDTGGADFIVKNIRQYQIAAVTMDCQAGQKAMTEMDNDLKTINDVTSRYKSKGISVNDLWDTTIDGFKQPFKTAEKLATVWIVLIAVGGGVVLLAFLYFGVFKSNKGENFYLPRRHMRRNDQSNLPSYTQLGLGRKTNYYMKFLPVILLGAIIYLILSKIFKINLIEKFTDAEIDNKTKDELEALTQDDINGMTKAQKRKAQIKLIANTFSEAQATKEGAELMIDILNSSIPEIYKITKKPTLTGKTLTMELKRRNKEDTEDHTDNKAEGIISTGDDIVLLSYEFNKDTNSPANINGVYKVTNVTTNSIDVDITSAFYNKRYDPLDESSEEYLDTITISDSFANAEVIWKKPIEDRKKDLKTQLDKDTSATDVDKQTIIDGFFPTVENFQSPALDRNINRFNTKKLKNQPSQTPTAQFIPKKTGQVKEYLLTYDDGSPLDVIGEINENGHYDDYLVSGCNIHDISSYDNGFYDEKTDASITNKLIDRGY